MDEDKFKLALATDFIVFMTHIWIVSTNNNVDGDLLIKELMNKWSERVESSATIMKEQVADQLVEQGAAPSKDVAMILLDVNNIYNKTVKGEFKTQMREAILKGLEAYSKQ